MSTGARMRTGAASRIASRAASRVAAIAVVLAAFVLVTAGCSTSGRDLDPPSMAPLPPTTTLVAIEGDAGFALTSSDLFDGALPADTGAQTGNVSPALAWTNTPESAAELALVATDDTMTTVHWLATGLVTTDQIVERGTPPAGGTVRPNSSGVAGWTGPVASPNGPVVVVFRLFALQDPLVFDAALTPDAAVAAIAERSFATATLTGTFGG